MISYCTISLKVPVVAFQYITLSTDLSEAVLHIENEDDIYFTLGKEQPGFTKFKRILKELDTAYTNQTSNTLKVYRLVSLSFLLYLFENS